MRPSLLVLATIISAFAILQFPNNVLQAAEHPRTIVPRLVSPPWTAESDQAGADFGEAAATAGDVNGDGYSDLIIGAPHFSNGQADEGRSYLYLGSASGLTPMPAWTAESDRYAAQFGWSVATAGDVNGDGYADVIVGAPRYSNLQTGRAYVYLGSPSPLAASPGWTAESSQSGSYFGWSVASAGDVNGDGYADVIVGSPLFTHGQAREGRAFGYLGSPSGLEPDPTWIAEIDLVDANFGGTVASAGDVNGDGYSDVIVGTHVERALVYLGSSAGLSATPAWTGHSDQADADFGYSVGTAGDVNDDGYSDVIVGAPGTNEGQGRAYVYFGSPSGLLATPAWTQDGAQGNSALGRAVGAAGDVNGDGYSDVIVATGDGNGGRMLVYLGSPSGLSASPGATADGSQSSENFGGSVGTAGDVNGDGYSDVVVGADGYTNGQVGEGRAYAYGGSPTAPVASPERMDGGATELRLEVSPNPFSSSSTFAYALPRGGAAHLAVYDVAGRLVALLVDGVAEPGPHVTAWSARDGSGRLVSSGTYFVKLRSAGRSAVQRIVLVRE